MPFVGELLSAGLVFQLRILHGEIVGEHVDITTLDAAGDLENREFLFVGQRGVELVHDSMQKIGRDLGSFVVVDVEDRVGSDFRRTHVVN